MLTKLFKFFTFFFFISALPLLSIANALYVFSMYVCLTVMFRVNLFKPFEICSTDLFHVSIICMYVICFCTTNTHSKAESIQSVLSILNVLFLLRVACNHDICPHQNIKMFVLSRVQWVMINHLHQLNMLTSIANIKKLVTQANT